MMKKNKFIVLISALLCAVMLFSSCAEEGGQPVVDDTPKQDGPVNVEQTFPTEAETDDLSAAITDVNKYLGYIGDSNAVALNNAYKLADSRDGESVIAVYKYMAVIKQRQAVPYSENLALDMITEKYRVVSLLDGRDVFVSNPVYYVENSTPVTFYGFNVISDIIVEVEIKNAIDMSGNFEKKYEYHYIDGTKLCSVSEKYHGAEVVEYPDEEYIAVTIDTKTYIIRDNEIVYEFSAGAERNLPAVFHEYAGYMYVLNSTENEIYIQVLNSKYECISEFQLPAKIHRNIAINPQDVLENAIFVLGNGNMLIQGIYSAEDEGDYDVINHNQKYKIYTALYDVVAGTVKEINPGFIISSIYSAENSDPVCSVSKDYNVASVLKYNDEREIIEEVAVILNNDVNIVAEFPTFLATQTAKCRDLVFVDSTRFIFKTVVNEGTFIYLVDSVAKEMTLISNDAKFMDGYFYTDEVIYDYSLNELYRMLAGESVLAEIGNGLLISDGKDYKIFSIGAYNVASVKNITELGDVRYVTCGNDYVVFTNLQSAPYSNFYIYNSKGECVLITGSNPSISEIDEGIYCVSFEYYDQLIEGGSYMIYKKTVVLSNK